MDAATGTIIGAIVGAIALIIGIFLKPVVESWWQKKTDKSKQPLVVQLLPNDFHNSTTARKPSNNNYTNSAVTISLPYPQNKYFTGRIEKLKTIHQKLQEQKRVYITGSGGIGKSAIALEYAYEHKADYDVIWWINADEQNKVQADFKEFVLAKRLVGDYETTENIILIMAKEWLNNNPRWLFIYDNANADDFNKWLKQYLPQNVGDVIITTRDQYFPIGEKIDLLKFEETEALEFLEKRVGRFDEKTKDLAYCLEYFPLALEQAGAYIQVTQITYEKYIEEYEKKLEHDENLTNYDKSIYATLQISIDKIKQDGAKRMLNLCAYFKPDRIPKSLFVESKVFFKIFKDNTPIEDIVAELVKYSLLKS